MQIVDFATAHIEQAIRIAKQNYDEERSYVPALPPVDKLPNLTPFVENGLGVAAFDGGELVGFLCCCNPWDGAFSIPGLRHVYSPMGANGTVAKNRAKIYARLYQAAGAKWVRAGATINGICLYAHDTEGQALLFRYGFGMRTVDAIRGMDEIVTPLCDGYTFSELAPEDIMTVLPLGNLHVDGYIESPFFMYREQESEAQFLKDYQRFQSIYFIAQHKEQPVAYIQAELDGETFIQDTPGYLHCKGLYCLPEHRGKGISQNLLNMLTQKLKTQGYTRQGVDFESFNPSGSGFWMKYFDAYTYGVVRRIDESVLKR
jgi:GNAT superfamily N-acetyltransferase